MRVLLVLILSTLLFVACTSTGAVTPGLTSRVYETTNIIPVEYLSDASEYWNIKWEGSASQLYDELSAINSLYFQTHRYIPGKTDCNDMVVDIWNEFVSQGIVSLIVVGNVRVSQEAFADSNHAWLMVYSGEGSAVAVEATNGKIYSWDDAQVYPHLKQYWEGFIYENPSDLWADFKERW